MFYIKNIIIHQNLGKSRESLNVMENVFLQTNSENKIRSFKERKRRKKIFTDKNDISSLWKWKDFMSPIMMIIMIRREKQKKIGLKIQKE